MKVQMPRLAGSGTFISPVEPVTTKMIRQIPQVPIRYLSRVPSDESISSTLAPMEYYRGCKPSLRPTRLSPPPTDNTCKIGSNAMMTFFVVLAVLLVFAAIVIFIVWLDSLHYANGHSPSPKLNASDVD